MFILAGNGSYNNRGCEAIVRGTVDIFRKYFDKPEFAIVSNFNNDSQFQKQSEMEYDGSIKHFKAGRHGPRFSGGWFFYNTLRFCAPQLWSRVIYRDMLPLMKNARAVLSVGGDNYSLDYGKPVIFTALDDLVISYKKPIIIWGASVGPFDKMPGYEQYMINHLKKVTGIFVRESLSLEYMKSKGVKDNVFFVADPAFMLEPVEPKNPINIEEGAIGVNISPLMAKYWTGGSYEQLVLLAAQIVRKIYERTLRKIYLIPHVVSPHSNDHAFMEDVVSLLDGVDVELVGEHYNAAETKWIISEMAVFAGARTHSTIAALSSGVPTLSFAYSIKAKGINRDIFGHEDYCVADKDRDPFFIAEKVKAMLDKEERIRGELCDILPGYKQKALLAGHKLKEICG